MLLFDIIVFNSFVNNSIIETCIICVKMCFNIILPIENHDM